MIENPKVGQRVAVRDMYGHLRVATIVEVQSFGCIRVEDGGWSMWSGRGHLMDATSLREQAQALIAAAEKLEQEDGNA